VRRSISAGALVNEKKYATLLIASQPPVFSWLGGTPAGTWWR